MNKYPFYLSFYQRMNLKKPEQEHYDIIITMITITSTAESLEQAKALLEAGVDRLYIGEKIMVYAFQLR